MSDKPVKQGKRKRDSTQTKGAQERKEKKLKEKKSKFDLPDLEPQNSLQGYVVHTTGRLNVDKAQLIAYIQKHGGIYSGTMTKKVNCVITGDKTLESDKMDKAKAQGVEVVDLEWLKMRCLQPPSRPPVEESKQTKKPELKVLLAHNYHDSKVKDPKGWLMSEKYDGVRAYWDKTRFLSRQGNQFFAPQFILDLMPIDLVLDGELYGGRGTFQLTVGIVKSHNAHEEWKKLRYLVFDAPELQVPCEKRFEILQNKFKDHPFILVVRQETCQGSEHVQQELKRVEAQGGEGLMLRQPGSFYEGKRSKTLLKVKSFKDSDALVIGHEPGKGKQKNVVGSLRCKWKNGKEFNVGSGFTDAERADPPKIGSVIEFKYQELTDAGVPRFLVFKRTRPDLTWTDS